MTQPYNPSPRIETEPDAALTCEQCGRATDELHLCRGRYVCPACESEVSDGDA